MFLAEVKQPLLSHFRKPLFVDFRQVFLFLILFSVTKAANFYFKV